MEKNKTGVKQDTTLDELDYAILSYLQSDGRTSFTVIAEKLKVSIGTVRTRFNRLLEEGIISIIGRVCAYCGFCTSRHVKRAGGQKDIQNAGGQFPGRHLRRL